MVFCAIGMVSVKPAEAAIKKNQIKIQAIKKDGTAIHLKLTTKYNNPYTNNIYKFNQLKMVLNGKQVGNYYLIDTDTKKVQTEGNIKKLKKNRCYRLYGRTVTAQLNKSTGKFRSPSFSAWSKPVVFTTAKYTIKGLPKSAGVGFSVKAPKIKGIKNYTLYLKKGNGKYKKIKTFKAKKLIKIKKFGKKAFTEDYYYIKIVPKTTDNKKCVCREYESIFQYIESSN